MNELNGPGSLQPDTEKPRANRHDGVFALENVTQLREAIEQVVYTDNEADTHTPDERAETIEVLTTLGQMGILTETDLDEARKGTI
ncbi:hypothetical protein F5984_02900 [Rudanella paleaurantiibacter]|uniref:Uncharacterized protein n=1 Tax=Rudanella paleaurantiibacter TaxID=2614655 RepID=A0A7J5U5I1_9BACT|nr:hypothetical protein [Rudanella paleaurantiibacter]KAB7732911.1 hypothetical protein F5984_02900 [Rudanella paleaurantiibacter]